MSGKVTLRQIEGFRRKATGRDPRTSKDDIQLKGEATTQPLSHLLGRNVYPFAVEYESSMIYFIETRQECKHNEVSFMWIAVQANAKHLIGVTIPEFLAYVASLEAPESPNLVYIHHPTRCGSTLLHQVMGSHPDIESFSEDLVLENFLLEEGKHAAASEELYRAIVRFTALKFTAEPTRTLVFKSTGNRFKSFDKLLSIFPTSKHIYLTRDPIKISESWINVDRGKWLYRFGQKLRLYNVKVLPYSKTKTLFGGVQEDPFFAIRKRNKDAKPFKISIAEAWVLLVMIRDQFFALRHANPNLLYIRYEDILAKESLKKFLDPFLKFNLSDGIDESKYQKHSQAGPLAEALKHPYRKYTPDEREALTTFKASMSEMIA